MDDPGSVADPELLVEDRGNGVRWLTLHRPDARNALSLSLLATIGRALADADADRSVRVLVIRGAGPAFCAGHDLREIRFRRQDPDGGTAYFRALMASCGEVMQAIVRHRVPVIASVHGVASAAGAQPVANRSVPPERLEAEVTELAERIAGRSSFTLQPAGPAGSVGTPHQLEQPCCR